MQAFRLEARRLMLELEEGKRLLALPDRAELQRLVGKCDERIRGSEARLAKARADKSKLEGERQDLKRKLEESLRPRPGRITGWNADQINDRLQRVERALKKAEREIEAAPPEIQAQQQLRTSFQSRLEGRS